MPDGAKSPAPILVAYDGSPTARNAVSMAVQIARSQHFLIRGVYVIDLSFVQDVYTNNQPERSSKRGHFTQTDVITQLEAQGGRALAWLSTYCRKSGVSVTTSLELGQVPDIILQEAPLASLLGLGRCGCSSAAHAHHLGCHFRAIAHKTHQPLLVGGDEWRPIRRLLLAYSGSEDAQTALTWTALLRQSLPADIVILAVQEDTAPPERWRNDAWARLAEHDLADCRLLQRSGHPAAKIIAAAEESQADLVVLAGYHHTAGVDWHDGSTVDHVLRHTNLPLFIA